MPVTITKIFLDDISILDKFNCRRSLKIINSIYITQFRPCLKFTSFTSGTDELMVLKRYASILGQPHSFSHSIERLLVTHNIR